MKKLASAFMLLLIVSIAANKTYAQISVGLSINIAPPALPVYTQPACPVDGYLWTPGYWAYDQDGGYYWVPGVWVSPPRRGYLWTPSYWAYDGSLYVYHEGYWGRHIGFYGGINYGYGYAGHGYVGGRWAGNRFEYNTAVVNVNTTVVHNTYINKTVVNNVTVNNTSFNGPGGVASKPRPQEQAAEKEDHVQATPEQQAHRQVAVKDRAQFAKTNNGQPATTAMNKVNGNHFTPDGKKAERATQPDQNVNDGNKRDQAANKDNTDARPNKKEAPNNSDNTNLVQPVKKPGSANNQVNANRNNTARANPPVSRQKRMQPARQQQHVQKPREEHERKH